MATHKLILRLPPAKPKSYLRLPLPLLSICWFLMLPCELRLIIYQHLLVTPDLLRFIAPSTMHRTETSSYFFPTTPNHFAALVLSCKRVYYEALPILLRKNRLLFEVSHLSPQGMSIDMLDNLQCIHVADVERGLLKSRRGHGRSLWTRLLRSHGCSLEQLIAAAPQLKSLSVDISSYALAGAKKRQRPLSTHVAEHLDQAVCASIGEYEIQYSDSVKVTLSIVALQRVWRMVEDKSVAHRMGQPEKMRHENYDLFLAYRLEKVETWLKRCGFTSTLYLWFELGSLPKDGVQHLDHILINQLPWPPEMPGVLTDYLVGAIRTHSWW